MANKKKSLRVSPKKNIARRKTPAMKWLIIAGIALLLVVGVIYWRGQNNSNHTDDKELTQYQQEIKATASRQKGIVDFYNSSSLDRNTKIKVFYELMGPLGGLDPIANPAGVPDVHAIVNFLYGFNFKAFGFPVEEAGYSATAPVRYEQDFDEKSFYEENKDQLASLVSSFENNKDLTVLSLGYSTNYRINEYFGDKIRDYYWKVIPDSNSPFYTYQTITQEKQDVVNLRNEYDPEFKMLDNMKIQTVYKCDNKIVVIVDGLVDNAFGYIYNATNSNEVNCGLLLNRFRIKKDVLIDEKWRFWFAN